MKPAVETLDFNPGLASPAAMKLSPCCGAMLYRHSETYNGSERYQCKKCRKTITVRAGVIVNGRGPRVNDWRTQA